jgi:hypothetical protein
MRAATVLILLCTAATTLLGSAAAEPGVVRFDFETGDLQGWRVVEGQFGMVVCDRERFKNRPSVEYNKQGTYFLSTLAMPKDKVNDKMTGVLESPVFLLTGPQMSLLVGGGSHEDTYVALCDGATGNEVLRASGENTETMRRVAWDAASLVGTRVFLRVVDRHRGGWGHVTLDDFVAAGAIDPDATAARWARETRAKSLAPCRPIIVSTRAAIQDLLDSFGPRYPDGHRYLTRLADLERRLEQETSLDQLQSDLLALQREALVANPLVSAQPILFVVREQYQSDHHNTATLFQTGEINTAKFRGPGALKSIDLGRNGSVRTLVELPDGIARDPEVHFSGGQFVFSMRRSIEDDYHIYRVNSDGTGLTQLTHGPGVSDIDPMYLPDGRIAFTSTREPKYCMCNRHIMGNLFRMEADGANVHQIGRSTLFEGHGALMPDGGILYDRWEYVDRNFGDAQGLWICNPDGTNHALYWGNNTRSPGGVIDARIIPGTGQAICIFGSCHDRPWGALAIIDRRLGLEGKAPVVRTWPSSAIDLVMTGNWDAFKPVNPKYEDPYPLSDKYFLCSRMTGEGESTGIYLLDVFGNEVLLHAEEPGCFDPMPLAPHPRPPIVPDRIDLDRENGYFYVLDVYSGTGMERVERGAVKQLRVVESPEKRFWTQPGWPGQGQEAPAMNWHDFNNKRILGTVPVESDGSAYFSVPADKFVYFQLLDEDGMMIQSMRSGAIARPGETLGCTGCHESRLSSAPNRPRAAFTQAPTKLQPWRGRPREFSYVEEVQPVFDRHCVGCHDYGTPAGETLNLAGDRGLAFSASYNELWRKNYLSVVGAGPAEIQPPYSWGSHASRLVQVLREGHQGVELDGESFDRIVTWIDLNAPYYPTYASAYPENPYGRSPLSNDQLKRLGSLTGVDFLNSKTAHETESQISFDRPELSPCLLPLQPRSTSEHPEALAIIRAGQAALAARPRADMPGFALSGIEADREAKYQELARIEAATRRAMLDGEKMYPYRP